MVLNVRREGRKEREKEGDYTIALVWVIYL